VKKLEALVEADTIVDSVSHYEMEAYVNSMKGVYQLEKQQWQDALDSLLRSKVIYQKLSEHKDSLEAVIYQEKISQLDTFIRLCCLNLKLSNSQAQEQKLAGLVSEQVSKAYADTKQEKIENIQEVTYNGKSIPLKSERLRMAFKKVENHLDQLQNQSSLDNKEQIQNYLKFANILDDA
jgi:hypothetical protein